MTDRVTLPQVQQAHALRAQAHQALQTEIKRLQASPLSAVNEGVELATEISVLGILDVVGFIFFGIDCALVLPDGSNLRFEASGFSFVFGEFDCLIAGTLVLDPKAIPEGRCHYSIACGAEGEGVVVFSLYLTNGRLIGTFAGIADGIGMCVVSGDGTIRKT